MRRLVMSDLSKLPKPGMPCIPIGVTDPQGIGAFTLRFGTATAEAVQTGSVTHPVNGDLTNFLDGLGSYSKALLQDSPGIANPGSFTGANQSGAIRRRDFVSFGGCSGLLRGRRFGRGFSNRRPSHRLFGLSAKRACIPRARRATRRRAA